MQLLSFTPKFFGPYEGDQKLLLDPEVTVITGANDVGKTGLLRVVEGICISTNDAACHEDEANLTRVSTHQQPWASDPEIGAFVKLLVSDSSWFSKSDRQYVTPYEVKTFFRLAPGIPNDPAEVRAHTPFEILQLPRKNKVQSVFNDMPRVKFIVGSPAITDVVNMQKPNEQEKAFLEAIFSKKFRYDAFTQQNVFAIETNLVAAAENFTRLANEYLPSSLKYQFRFTRSSSEPEKLLVQVVDQHRGMTRLNVRGAGTKKLMGIMISLLSFVSNQTPCLILIDEPETSLHADAQRNLRTFLEGLAKNPHVQVVYTTHSPVMINPTRPESVRLVTLETEGNSRAKAKIDNKPYGANHYKVRMSLGVCPADALLFSDVGVIVEGDTECLSLPILLARLSEANVAGFESAATWLGAIHFINGAGDSISTICTLARMQGVEAVIFLDGDKRNSALSNSLSTKHPDVPCIMLPERIDLEQVIPRHAYFEAVQAVHDLPAESATEDAFNTWLAESTQPYIQNRMFSRQVNDWMQSEFDFSLDKPRTLRYALERVDLGTLQYMDKIKGLHDAITAMMTRVAV
jgi:ABC-type transport system involved in cytochrome c biogenesis ATPase subunit